MPLERRRSPVPLSKGVSASPRRRGRGIRNLMAYLPRGFWVHYVTGGGEKTREQAIQTMHDSYNRSRGRRRKPSEETFEVFRSSRGVAGWILYVRLKRRVRARRAHEPSYEDTK